MDTRLFSMMRSIASRINYEVRIIPRDIIWPYILLTGEYIQLISMMYRRFLHFRLRQALRITIGVPTSAITLYMCYVNWFYYPEPDTILDTSSVANCKIYKTTSELLEFAYGCSRRYHQYQKQYQQHQKHEEEQQQQHNSFNVINNSNNHNNNNNNNNSEFPPIVQNALVGDLLIILRSLSAISGTFEERSLVTASITVTDDIKLTRSSQQEQYQYNQKQYQQQYHMVSPAEIILRTVLAIALDQGWFDIVEEARKMFSNFVKEHPLPPQANVTSAVADLCALSYELEKCTNAKHITLTQRQRVAKAIDAFRPGRSVKERCTIAAEIEVLPIVDLDKTTRCLMLTRRSPGRRPQLIITFIGSNSVRNWWTNFKYWPIEPPKSFFTNLKEIINEENEKEKENIKKDIKEYGGLRIHRGFLELLLSIAFEDAAKEFDQIILIGHSLGGALAQIAGIYLANERKERKVTVLTVASPRVFASSQGFWQHISSKLSFWQHAQDENNNNNNNTLNTIKEGEEENINNNNNHNVIKLPHNYRHIRAFMCADVVPHLPPIFIGYQHIGIPLILHTGCPTRISYIAWGLWSCLFHSADMYKSVLEQPAVAQLHHYHPNNNNNNNVE